MIDFSTWTPGEVTGLVAIVASSLVTILVAWLGNRSARRSAEAASNEAQQAREDERRIAREARDDGERREWNARGAAPIQDARSLIHNLYPVILTKLVTEDQTVVKKRAEAVDQSWQRVRDGLGPVSIAHPSTEVREAAGNVLGGLSRYVAGWQLTLSLSSRSGDFNVQPDIDRLNSFHAEMIEAIDSMIERLHDRHAP